MISNFKKGTIFTGGATFGLLHASNPMVTLLLEQQLLKIQFGFIISYEFSPNDVVDLVPKRLIFLKGLKIVHTKNQYPQRITFYTWEFDKLLSSLNDLGFHPAGDPQKEAKNSKLIFPGVLFWSLVAIAVLLLLR